MYSESKLELVPIKLGIKDNDGKEQEASPYYETAIRINAQRVWIDSEKDLNNVRKKLYSNLPKGTNIILNSFETSVYDKKNSTRYWFFWRNKKIAKSKLKKMVLTRVYIAENVRISEYLVGIDKTYTVGRDFPKMDIDKMFGKFIGDMIYEGCYYIPGTATKKVLCS